MSFPKMSVKVYICDSASHQDQPGLIYTVKSGYFHYQ